MKRIALSLVVVAASGAYVWSQSGRDAADALLGPAPASDELPTGSIENQGSAPVTTVLATTAQAAPLAKVEWPARDESDADEWSEKVEDKAETRHSISAQQIAVRLQWPPLPPAPTAPAGTGTVALAEDSPSPRPALGLPTTLSAERLVPPPPPPVEARLPRPRPAYHPPVVRATVTPAAMSSGTMTVASNGSYADGTFTGPVVDAYYGLVQIRAIVQGGQLTGIKIVRYPSDRLTSVFINRRALPRLRNEAIRAQSANVNIVSGATLTSEAFIRSLGGALSEASA
jgi:uncharacterized protein with FMN-binding domain